MNSEVVVQGISKEVDGIYVIKDKTNARIKNTIDILVQPGKLYGRWDDVKICKVNEYSGSY
jgi:3D (Asp-Asp-Asp) domain-containing protein